MKPAVLDTLMIVPAPRRRSTRPAVADKIITARTMTSRACSCGVMSSSSSLPLGEAGIVDQNFHGLFDAGEPIGHPLDIVPLCEVGRDRLHRRLIAVLEDGGRLRQPVGISGHEHEVVAACRISPGERRPYP